MICIACERAGVSSWLWGKVSKYEQWGSIKRNGSKCWSHNGSDMSWPRLQRVIGETGGYLKGTCVWAIWGVGTDKVRYFINLYLRKSRWWWEFHCFICFVTMSVHVRVCVCWQMDSRRPQKRRWRWKKLRLCFPGPYMIAFYAHEEAWALASSFGYSI